MSFSEQQLFVRDRFYPCLLDAEVAVGRPDGVKEGAVGHAARRHPGEDLICN